MQKIQPEQLQIQNKPSRPQTLQHPYNKGFNDILVNDNGNSWLEEKDKWLIPSANNANNELHI